jgi:hypothetical protein
MRKRQRPKAHPPKNLSCSNPATGKRPVRVALAVLRSQSLAPHPGKALAQRPKAASRFFTLMALI